MEEENKEEKLASLDAFVAALHSLEAELVEDESRVVASLPQKWASLDAFVVVCMVCMD